MIKVLSLFSGIGAFEKALENQKFFKNAVATSQSCVIIWFVS